MVEVEKLKNIIDESGMTMVAIARKCNISRETLYRKVSGYSEFTASEIVRLTDILNLSKRERDDIFLSQ